MKIKLTLEELLCTLGIVVVVVCFFWFGMYGIKKRYERYERYKRARVNLQKVEVEMSTE
jgi:hypothetical protein